MVVTGLESMTKLGQAHLKQKGKTSKNGENFLSFFRGKTQLLNNLPLYFCFQNER
jgi:hypothetical protein